jgi:hypothetical protein
METVNIHILHIEFGGFYVHGQDIMVCSLVNPAWCIRLLQISVMHESFDFLFLFCFDKCLSFESYYLNVVIL